MSVRDDGVDLVDAVVYADLFDAAVTLDELWRYSRLRSTPEALRRRLAEPDLRAVIRECDGFYCLAGRETLAHRRRERRARAAALRRRAARVAGVLRFVPFVRGIVLTGSVAADDADPEADVDLLVIVAAGRLASVFAMLGTLSRLLSRRVFCPNYYLSEAHLPLRRRDLYVAREIAQTAVLAGEGHALLAANAWIREYLPNAADPAPASDPPHGGRAQRWLERPLRGRLGDRLERAARRLALSRLAAHHGGPGRVPDDVRASLEADTELRFHGSAAVEGLLERYAARREEVARALRESRERSPRTAAWRRSATA